VRSGSPHAALRAPFHTWSYQRYGITCNQASISMYPDPNRCMESERAGAAQSVAHLCAAVPSLRPAIHTSQLRALSRRPVAAPLQAGPQCSPLTRRLMQVAIGIRRKR
jgi:hypothetical protein